MNRYPNMKDMCAACGRDYGKHFGMNCSLDHGGRFVLATEEKAEQPRAPYFAEAVEDDPAPAVITIGDLMAATLPDAFRAVYEASKDPLTANAAMIARDGPAKPVALQATPVAQEATSHAPLAGLTVLMERDHRFGSCVVHGE